MHRFACLWLAVLFCVRPALAGQHPQPRFEVALAPAVASAPLTGRLFVMLSHRQGGEPRLTLDETYAYYFNDPHVGYAPLFSRDVQAWRGGKPVSIGVGEPGFPYSSIDDLPPGDYIAQAVLNVYTQFHRADGRTIWAHADRGEGQQFHKSPGNLVSEPVPFHIDRTHRPQVHLRLSRSLPAIDDPKDTPWLKHVKFRSALISRFWGTDMYFGATVLLPKGYEDHPEVHYPVVFHQGHFTERNPLYFPDEVPMPPPADAPAAVRKLYESKKALVDAWDADDMPRMIVVTLQHPTPFYDDSYLQNSPNNGPWEDVFFQEMLPFLEQRFRILAEP